MGLVEELAADRQLGAEITQLITADARREALIAAASRHNARVDAPYETKKGWQAQASGVVVDPSDQTRHPWHLTGQGETDAAAVDDLIAKLGERPVAGPKASACPTCGQALP